MGGGGGGGPFVHRSPEKLGDLVRKAERDTSDAAFEAELSKTLGQLLGAFNSRDVPLVRDRLDQAKAALEDEVDDTIDQFFGGSVAKHTYVDGLSDIDCLILVDDTELEAKDPRKTLDRITKILDRELSDEIVVSQGRMAVTLTYPDGMTIQLLPAIRNAQGDLKVPSSRRDGWSAINPEAFRNALVRRNEQCGGKLIPTIKLAKAINGTLPEPQRLSGYHMESLAIAAFRGYDGPKTAAAMLPVFFERAKDLVLSPIEDRTGQSIHVDNYLGPKGSEARIAASHVLSRLAKRMRNASAAKSIAQWQALFGLDA